MKTYVFAKDAGDLVQQQALVLAVGETITNISVGPTNPVTASPPTFTILSSANPVEFKIVGGEPGVSYSWALTITTNQGTKVVTFAVVVNSGIGPGLRADPDSYQQLVGQLDAGAAALATTMFQLPPTTDASQGYVTWDVLDSLGVVHSSGNAFSYTIRSVANSIIVVAQSVVSVPESTPPSLDSGYQLRYTLTLRSGQVAYAYESIQVTGFPEMALGTQDALELVGDTATMTLVTDKLYANYAVEIWRNGELLSSSPVGNPQRVAQGYYVAASIATDQLPVSWIPFNVIWKYWNTDNQIFRETSALWLVNDMMTQAVEDVKSKINKARQTLYGTEDSQFPGTEVAKWLRRGMDLFNAAYGQFTNFTMTRAMGPVREYWLLCSEKAALDAQYLMEGEKAFNFQGANISLDVDRTSYIDSMSSKIQGQLDNELKPIKQNLIIKGNSGGDGSGPNGDGNFSALTRGAMGAVGITISPASIYGNLRGLRRG